MRRSGTSSQSEHEDESEDAPLTRSEGLLGTPSYLSPEQTLNAKAATPLSDVYALGATLYTLLTGAPPPEGARPGHFFVPYPPDGATPEQVTARLATNNRHGAWSIAVHEAYPGHHWHLVMMKSNPSKLRQVFRTPYFSEGWALYAERLMDELETVTLKNCDASSGSWCASSSTKLCAPGRISPKPSCFSAMSESMAPWSVLNVIFHAPSTPDCACTDFLAQSVGCGSHGSAAPAPENPADGLGGRGGVCRFYGLFRRFSSFSRIDLQRGRDYDQLPLAGGDHYPAPAAIATSARLEIDVAYSGALRPARCGGHGHNLRSSIQCVKCVAGILGNRRGNLRRSSVFALP